jgi:DNA-binding response OmpR family regulator
MPTVLVVDGDRVSRRFVEHLLTTNPVFLVEVVSDARSALELTSTQIVDMIVSETVLPDMDGLQLFRRLGRESRLREVPFVFFSADNRTETKINAYRSGIDDYVCKPCDPNEFIAKLSAILKRQSRRRIETTNKSYTLAGDFSTMSFPDLASILEIGKKTGLLAITTKRAVAHVHFDAGNIVHALYGTLSGDEAFYALVACVEGQFEFTPRSCELKCNERTIKLSVTSLIMEGARRYDDAHQNVLPRQRGIGSSYPVAENSNLSPLLIPAQVPNQNDAHRYEYAILESFTLGDFRLLNEQALVDFTANTQPQHRFHAWLIANREEAISALLPLAGAPSERLYLDSLTPGHKTLCLSFDLRDDRLLDILLIDAHAPMVVSSGLKLCPSVVVLAPPKGDMMALDIQSRVALQNLFNEYNVKAIVGIGLPTLEDHLSRIGITSNDSRVVCCLRGVLGDGTFDMRRLLLHAVRLWSSMAVGGTIAAGGERA